MEVLSPVGSFASLSAAFQAGADAVYFGLGALNMRAAAAVNFTVSDLPEIMKMCHKHNEHNTKAYLALNTVVFDGEQTEIDEILDAARLNNVDAIIASDIAVILAAKARGLTVHISTQCNVTNIEAVRFYAQYADTIVLARELSIKQIADITKKIKEQDIRGTGGELIKIEIFAHGAFCMATSGKCYLSLDHYNRSANRGSCLQLCRRAYMLSEISSEDAPKLKDGERNTYRNPQDGLAQIVVDNEYLLSPKDLKTIDFLDKIAAAGVSVLKIEGRGRSADYVKTVTRVYKEAVQSIDDGTYSKKRCEEWNTKLATVYNRGFWTGYYLGKNIGEWTQQYGSKATTHKTYIGKITNYFSRLKVAEVKIEAGVLHKGDKYMVIGNTTGVYEDTLNEIRLDLNPVSEVKQGDLCSIPTRELLRRGDKLYLITDI